jgi:hypothetical protein
MSPTYSRFLVVLVVVVLVLVVVLPPLLERCGAEPFNR